ncbi:hypothetical protein ACFVW5_17885 [Streptomyces sp. NPDC058232]|uniref:hypothetical protein n=1 Tax=Streptomyces sp. NPDC058232 TaxID=3346393 RepID=UPI0036EEED89
MNLTTGSYTTGVPPAGTAACGDSRSITVSGVFCDVADDGTVHGLVLVEYHYADDGSIDSVRLVDAATGTTYTLQGQLTVCPSGGDDDESPGEAPAVRQVVERCGCDDSDGDGIGDVRYVELWSVDTTGLSPAFLIGTYIDGDFDQPYIPANPVDCQDAGGDESPGEPTQTCAPRIVERCGCDDSDGDGIGDVRYTELWAIDPCGGDAPALLGAWVDGDFDQPYTPVAPVDCIGGDESPGELAAGFEVAPVPLCVIDDATGNVLQNVLAEVVYDQTTGDRTGVRYVDQVTGAAVPVPGGAHLGVCPQTGACSNCETLLLCDVDPTSPSTIAGTAASGTLSNGVGWTATGPAPFAPSRQSDGAAWWGLGLFPNSTTPVTTWTFDQPVTAEFSVAMSYVAGTAAGANTVQLPAGAQPLSLPPGYTFDRATGVLSADATVTGCPQIRTPSRETSARFRVTGVTSFALQYLGVRALVLECQVFGSWVFGAVDVSLGGQFLRTTCRDCQGEVLDVTDTTLDGTSPYTPTGIVGVCHPPEAEPCASTVQILRLCDLNPAVEPGDDGKRCAVPFLRHLVHSCDGALAETRDTEMDGTTAYTPVKVVDCGSGGVPALSELLWPQTGIAEDPAGVARQDFVYTVTNPETGEVAQVKLHASSASPGGCGAYDPANPVFNNPTVYTLTLDDAAQEMSTFRLDLLDFDTFEGVTGLSPIPSRVEGDVTWNGSTITANQSNSTAYVYFDSPPAQIAYRYGNTGGGLACTSVRFQGMTLVPDGCCGCGTGEVEVPGTGVTLLLCDTAGDGTVTDFLRHVTYTADGTPDTVTDTALDGLTPYTPSGAVGRCSDASSSPGTPEVCTYTLPDRVTGFDTASTAFPGCWVGTGGATEYDYGDRVTSWEMTSYQSDVDTASNVQFDTTQTLGGPVDFATFTPLVPSFPTLTAPGYVGTATANGVTITLTDTAGQGLSHVGATTLLRLNPGTGFRLEFSEPVQMTVKPSGFADPPADNERFCGVTAQTVPWDAVKEPDGTYTDAATGDPVPDDATVTCVPGTGDEPCRNASTLLLCDLPQDGEPELTVTDTDPTPYYSDPVAAPVTGAQALWAGGTLDVPPGTAPQPGTLGTVNTLAATLTAARPACDDGTATVTVSVLVAQTGPDDACGAAGHLRLFNGTQQVALEVVPNNAPVGWSATLTTTATVPAADVAAGNVAVVMGLDAYDSGSCTPDPRTTGWNLSQFTASTVYDQDTCAQQVLANVVSDCDTGQVESVTYTTLDGAPYSVMGEVGQCTATSLCTPAVPCGDTEVAQLCDLTYDPQAPIPTPAGDFTLTGNVVAANGGTTLWFAQANQVANGVAELTVSGLLPAVMYEFRFASTWVGAGAPDPANNNAIYLLEVLDGTTVLATRTRNTSNGSNAFPGGVMSEDLPPLAFIAPATGAVTIRFTDQTTGGAINDRDLYLMPIEVRTAVLTVTSTPFLRRFTFDCDGGLTSTQDLGLDGATPYVVEGEVGSCASSGDGSSVTAPTGDVVDCEDGSRALLVKVCDASDELPGEPCGDTELVALCDLVYSPEPPFPTPMSAFARTGNVKVVGAGLYYSGGNVAPNGVATLPVTGLTGDTGYAFRFSTSWAGSGVPNPAASDAIYLVEILDGTTVLVSQQRNISNGTGAATGYVDETPLSFTAPASGAVTLRISDVSTGNGADRDLIVIPADVRSEALTVGATAFLRAITFGCDGSATSAHDLALDGVTPYTVAGEVATCAAGGDGATSTAPGPDTEAVVLCDLPTDPGADPVPFLRLLTVTADGTVTAADTALDGVTPYTVAGTVGVCPGAPDGPVKVVEQCRCDQTADGVVEYVELIAVAEGGTLTTIGTYDEAFAPYTPVSPVVCPVEGAPPAMGVQARRVELAPGGSWSAAGVTLLQSVTAVSHAGNGTVTTMDGDSTLHDGESVTWSVARDADAALTGPLTITAGTGTVTVAFTTAVTL